MSAIGPSRTQVSFLTPIGSDESTPFVPAKEGSRRRPNATLTVSGINHTKRGRYGRPWDRSQSVQIGFDRHDFCAEARIIHLQIFHNSLHVITRFGQRDSLYPIDSIDLGVARIAMLCHPLLHPAAACVVAGEGHDVGTFVLLE